MKIFKLLLKPGNVPPNSSELFFVFGFIQCLIENVKNINIDGKKTTKVLKGKRTDISLLNYIFFYVVVYFLIYTSNTFAST